MERMNDLLVKTSRTFSLAIPLLPEPTRSAISLAYFLFRIADTLEDALLWPPAVRLEALEQLSRALSSLTSADIEALRTEWLEQPPTTHAGYLELIDASPVIFQEIDRLDSPRREIVIEHAQRTIRGMHRTVSRAGDRGDLRLATLEDLQAYCYLVAGIVGELLTELFVLDAPSLSNVKSALVAHGTAFGEGLQLVNILKDESEDEKDGRTYLPQGVPRAAVLALARHDMARAREYIDALKRGGAPPGYIGFTSLAADLADATLERVEREGAGAKVPRSVVMEMFVRHGGAPATPSTQAEARSGSMRRT